MTATISEMKRQRDADRQAQLDVSEPYVAGPFYPGHYSTTQRDTHHYDIFAERRPGYVQSYYEQYPSCVAYPMADGMTERAFAIRGEPGRIYIRDERWDLPAVKKDRPQPTFGSVAEALEWAHNALMGTVA